MKIVSTYLPQKYDGLLDAARLTVGEIIMWDTEVMPVFEMLDIAKPDVVFIDLKYITSSIIQASKEGHTRFILFGNGKPTEFVPSAIIAKPSMSPVMRKHIESDEYKVLYLKDSANVASIWGGKHNKNMVCDFGYNMTNNDPEFMPHQIELIVKLSKLGKIRVVSDHHLSMQYYAGKIGGVDLSSFYKSVKINIDFDGGNILDIAANGGFCVSKIPNKLFPSFDNIVEIVGWLGQNRDKIARQAQRKVLAADTCYHRLADMMNSIGETEVGSKALKRAQDLICNLE